MWEAPAARVQVLLGSGACSSTPCCTWGAPAARAQVPSGIRGKGVEDIVNEWSGELEALSRGFQAHAQKLAAWDRAILTSRHTLLDLEDHLQEARPAPLCVGVCMMTRV